MAWTAPARAPSGLLAASIAMAAACAPPAARATLGVPLYTQPSSGEFGVAATSGLVVGPDWRGRYEGLEYDVQRTPSGITIVQWAKPGDEVFCVAWEGAVKPDMRALLGPNYYPIYVHARAERGGWLRAASVITNAVTLHSHGRFGDFYGTACLGGRTPPGFLPTVPRYGG